MDSLLALVGRTLLEYITVIPGLLSHMAMEAAGEALIEYGPWVVIVLICRNPLIAMGALVGMALTFGITLMFSGEWSNRPRSLFSYETENRQNLD